MRKTYLWILLDSIFFIIFNLIFFIVIGTSHHASGWMSYVFILVSYLLLVITPFFTKGVSNKTALAAPIYLIGTGYFLIELIVGLIFILINQDSIKLAFLCQIIILGGYLILLVSNIIANENTKESIQKKESEMNFVKDSTLNLKNMMNNISDRELYKKFESAYDVLNSSPFSSSEHVEDLESQIMQLINQLKYKYGSNDINGVSRILDEIVSKANERNEMLK